MHTAWLSVKVGAEFLIGDFSITEGISGLGGVIFGISASFYPPLYSLGRSETFFFDKPCFGGGLEGAGAVHNVINLLSKGKEATAERVFDFFDNFLREEYDLVAKSTLWARLQQGQMPGSDLFLGVAFFITFYC